jgi:hypothetical protein
MQRQHLSLLSSTQERKRKKNNKDDIPRARGSGAQEVDGPGDWPVLVFSNRKRQEAPMKPFLASSLAALAGGLIVAGCAVAPVDGPYAYGYARPYYYDQGPAYYDAWPGYYPGYYYYGPPAIVGSFHFGDGGRDRRWAGGSWSHNSLNSGDQTTSRTFRAPRASTSRSHAAGRARNNRVLARHESDKS